jgi:hypothetical protein
LKEQEEMTLQAMWRMNSIQRQGGDVCA